MDIETLVANVKSITDRLDLVDQVLKANRLGRDTVMAFRCGESGLLYPGNYVKDWGKQYGIGLGPHPVSESLQSEYEVAPPAITPEIQSIEQIMHPLRSSGAQMDMVLVDASEFSESAAVLAKDDARMRLRVPILISKQLNNSRGRIKLMRMQFDKEGVK